MTKILARQESWKPKRSFTPKNSEIDPQHGIIREDQEGAIRLEKPQGPSKHLSESQKQTVESKQSNVTGE